MRIVGLSARLSTGLILAFLAIYVEAQPQEPPHEEKITVTGKLTRAMAIGGESTGWVVQFDSKTHIADKPAAAIEIEYHNTRMLEHLENQRVTVIGVLSQRQGAETGTRNVLVVSTIRKSKTATPNRN
jgi:hypothetical protein